jgi:aspartate aminotransferase-like enzyme
VEHAKLPRFYWDIRHEDKANKKGETYFSSSVPLIRALRVALKMMLAEGRDRQVQKALAMSKAVRAAGDVLGCATFSASPSPSVTALSVPHEVDGSKLRDLMERKHQITIAGGQDQLKGKIIRIGHLGHIGRTETLATVKALSACLQELGHPCDADAALRAASAALEGIL